MSLLFQNALNAVMWRRDWTYSGTIESRMRMEEIGISEIKIFAQKEEKNLNN